MTLELDERQRAMLQEMGVRVWLPGTAFAPPPPANESAQPTVALAAPVHAPVPLRNAPTPARVLPQVTAAAEGTALALDAMDAAAMAHNASQCKACPLCAGRRQTVLDADAAGHCMDWMVVGDPPDEDEERAGVPFVEQAGQLLDNMLKAVGVRRGVPGSQGAYLSTAVKCRPPHGRLPTAQELATCAAYLRREIALVRPKVVLAMGRFAVQALLADYPEQSALPLGKQRGQVYQYAGVPVVVTYHPKVLLRASADKAKAWADLCLALEIARAAAASLQSAP